MPKVAEYERAETSRLVAFSDGVIAIAITLLVFDLTVPKLPPGTSDSVLPTLVFDQRHELFGYALSFLVIGLYWMLHRRVFIYVTAHDRKLLWLNLFFLMFVAFLPFATDLFTDHPNRFGVSFYAVTQAATGYTLALLWLYAGWKNLVEDGLTSRLVLARAARFLVTPTVFLCSIAVAAVDVDLAILSWLLIVPLNALFELRVVRIAEDEV
ncbi:TMEM175 family protein [Haloarchaeobius sp. DFWS5]|uniref:TMEM175 family protein n=1 Tax=Haloarchaeobius sp. DFWS5 TaxID=3446114 RepID=UPI003EC12F64